MALITNVAISPNPALKSGTVTVGCDITADIARITVTFINPTTGAVDHVQEMIISGTTATASVDCSELTVGTYNVGDIEILGTVADGTTGYLENTLWAQIQEPTASGLGIDIYFEDAVGNRFDLTKDNAVYFGRMQLGTWDTNVVGFYVKNRDLNRKLKSVVLTPIRHPSEPIGPKEDTYDACTISLTESGGFGSTLTIPEIAAGSTQKIYAKWRVDTDASPGWGFFALKAEGVYDV